MKIYLGFRHLNYLSIIILCFSLQPSFASPEKIFQIEHTDFVPIIDGKLNEEVWREARGTEDFLQMEPDRFNPPSERTILKMAYDESALFLAFRCYDSNPSTIKTTLRRRDEEPPADWVFIGIDSRNDNQTAFIFKVNAGGLMYDAYMYEDGDECDESWDAVWEAETTVDDSGWAAEFRIPYTALRFTPGEEHIWGMNAGREIHRTNEEIRWAVYPREVMGEVSHFGELQGIKNIPQPFNLEILPYAYTKYQDTEEKTGLSSSAGCDLKYSLSSSVILDATFNPDFGQIEADPSVLNLGVFETWYDEKRPFFLEGASLFETEYDLFYSRRIGSSPGYYETADDCEEISRPENTTIIGATKITGRSSEGISFGVIEAVTDREYAEIEDENGNREEVLVEPYTNFLIGRIKKDIWEGNSYYGAIATALNREEGMSAYTGGVDWNLNFHGNDYSFSGQAAVSNRGDSGSERDDGYALYTELTKPGGKHHGFYLMFETESPDFNIWDMGFIGRNDLIFLYGEYLFRTREPVGIFRQTVSGIETWQDWNYDGYHLDNGVGIWTNLRYMNYWDTNFGVSYNFPHYSDLETRGGPVMRPPGNYGGWFWGGTDWQKNFRPSINFWGGRNESKSWWWGFYLELLYRPTDRIETSFSIGHERMFDENQWVDNIEDDADSTHYVFGRLKREEWSLTARMSYNFTRDLSLQLYLQPFNAVGDYSEYIELAEPETYNFKLFEPDDDYDFNYKELNFNLVFRWEYAPGSTIYAVWNRGMEDDGNPGSFNYRKNFLHLSETEGNDIFMLKINKWFDF